MLQESRFLTLRNAMKQRDVRKAYRVCHVAVSAIVMVSMACVQAQGHGSGHQAPPGRSSGQETMEPVPAVGKHLSMVNVLQGTDSVREFSHGNVLPLISAPFGMTDWSVQNYGGTGINERFFFQ